jgi:hypothetical protein
MSAKDSAACEMRQVGIQGYESVTMVNDNSLSVTAFDPAEYNVDVTG